MFALIFPLISRSASVAKILKRTKKYIIIIIIMGMKKREREREGFSTVNREYLGSW